MKVRTLGVLASLGMLLTSVTVWSLTPPGGVNAPLPSDGQLTQALQIADTPPADPVIRASFQAGGTLMVEGRLGHAKMQAGKTGETFLLATVTAEQGQAVKPASVNLSIVIDRSGSMKGKRLDNALAAARGMVDRLNDGDVVSVIAYDTQSEVLVAPTTIDERSRSRVRAGIAGIVARGDTCISCALDSAMTALSQRQGMVNRILLLTDGEPTSGVKDVSGFRSIASRARGLGTSIATVGVDVDYNERVLSALAQESNGRHYFVENAGSLARIFEQERAGLKKTVAKETELEVALAPGVKVLQVFDRTFRREGDRLFVPLGSFSGGDQKTLLVKLEVPRGAEGERAIASVEMLYRDLVQSKAGNCSGQLAAFMTSDPAQASPLDAVVAARLGRSGTSTALVTANELFKAGRIDEAQRTLESQLAQLKSERARATAAAPKSRREELEDSFDKQEGALAAANSGFAQPPPAPAPAQAAGAPARPRPKPKAANKTRKGKAQVRSNAESALDFAF